MDPIAIAVLSIWATSIVSIPVIAISGIFLTAHLRKRKLVKEEGAVSLPGHKGALVINDQVFPLELQAKALSRFIEEFNLRFPEKRTLLDRILGLKDLSRARKHLVIEWVDGDYFWTRDENNQEFPDGHKWRWKARGQFVGGHRVVTAARNHVEPAMSLGSTAFIHELNHWGLKIMTGNSDPDHAQDNAHGSTWTEAHDKMISELKAEFK